MGHEYRTLWSVGSGFDYRPIVLVVDDDRATRELIRDMLLDGGLGCETVSNGIEALQRVTCYRPAAVLLDLMIPKISGLVVADVLRHRYGSAVPVILMSANTGLLDMARRRPERFPCVDKPLDLPAVERLVDHLLNRVNGRLSAEPLLVSAGY